MYRIVLTAMLIVGVLSGFVEGSTVAYYTSTVTSTSNQFVAGIIDIASTPASAVITFTNMVPGDTVTAPLTVQNDGTLSVLYALSSTVTNADSKGLGAQLTLEVKTGVTTCTNAGFDTDGTTQYTGALGSLAGSLDLIGDPEGQPNGGRALDIGDSETLCFQVVMPEATSTAYLDATTTATFTFSAEQTAHVD